MSLTLFQILERSVTTDKTGLEADYNVENLKGAASAIIRLVRPKFTKQIRFSRHNLACS